MRPQYTIHSLLLMSITACNAPMTADEWAHEMAVSHCQVCSDEISGPANDSRSDADVMQDCIQAVSNSYMFELITACPYDSEAAGACLDLYADSGSPLDPADMSEVSCQNYSLWNYCPVLCRG
jgi:hypothetical protein